MPDESYRWAEEQIALLGQMSDPDIARRFGIPHHLVVAKRTELKIPAFRLKKVDRPTPVWTLELDAELALYSEKDLIEKYNLPIRAIRHRRRELGITYRPASKPARRINWTGEEDALLGTVSDIEAAKQLNRTREQVTFRRNELGIAVHKRISKYPFTAEQDVLLGTMSDAALAEKMGVDRAIVGQRRRHFKIPAFIPHGRMVEVSAEKLKARRMELGIPQKDMVMSATGRGSYIQLESGHTKLVGLKRLNQIAQVLQCRADDLMPSKSETDDAE